MNPIGVWGPVRLLAGAQTGIGHVGIRTEANGAVRLAFTVESIADRERALNLRLSLRPANHDGPGLETVIPVQAAPGVTQVEHAVRLRDARLWWPWDQGAPNLYMLEATLYRDPGDPLDRVCETFGVREVYLERSAERFAYHINGRQVFIRGTSYLPDLYLSRVTPATLARDLDLITDAGLNLARVHVHVSPKALYEMADRRGLMLWQDFELNWLHDYSAAFEARALALQRAMFRHLGNHPSIVTWCCYNEPTMLLLHRENMLLRPAPALYTDAVQQDPTRPVFLCSGQRAHDLERAGDVHTYYGAIWTRRFTDVHGHAPHLNTEFGFESPPTRRRCAPGRTCGSARTTWRGATTGCGPTRPS
ncbi:MAG: hypothetical protein M5R40_01350 [Anaerolineae bacterium]|nr:hypothetical protein [Anaerolineae bacterium]